MAEPLKDVIDGPWDSEDDEARVHRLRADLEHFVTGGLVDPAYLWKLRKTEEVWEIRSPRPRPSIRVFGRFAIYDVFVATHQSYRASLGAFASQEWKREIRNCQAKWRNLFHPYKPHSGQTINDYVSNAADPSLFE